MCIDIDILISVVLGTIMFGIGLSTPAAGFRKVFICPGAIVTGLSAQMIGLPVLVFIIAYLSGLSPEFQVGLIILAVCPGGTTSGFLTYLFRGNVALSISLTAVNSILTLLTIPLLVNLGLLVFMGTTTEIHLPVVDTMTKIFTVTILPAAGGVITRSLFPSFADRVERPLKIIFSVLFGLILVIMLFTGEKDGGAGLTSAQALQLLPVLLLINLLSFIMGFMSGKSTSLGYRNSFTIGIEVSMQNTTLAFLVGNTILHNREMIKPALIYAMFSFFTALLYSVVTKLLNGSPVLGEFRD